MPRKVRDANLESRSARSKLKARGEPYYRALAPGVHLGYRRNKTGGAWLLRWHDGAKYGYAPLDAVADDHLEADGRTVMTFGQAQEAARQLYAEKTAPAAPAAPLTVRKAMEAYISFLKAERRTADDAEKRLAKHVLPAIGDKLITELKQNDVEAVKRGMVRSDPDDPEVERRAKDSANRVLSSLKAALNMAFADEHNHVPNDKAWRAVKPFKGVGRARQVHLNANESRRLIGVCEGHFRDLVTAGLVTGARLGELTAMKVGDFDARLRTLAVRGGKTGAREIVLTVEGTRFLTGLAADKQSDNLLFPAKNGNPWGRMQVARGMRNAVRKAKLPRDTVFYSLRHSYASQSLLAGLNLQLLAENMGTSIRMIEQNYGKFLASSRRKLIQKGAFKLGLRPASSL